MVLSPNTEVQNASWLWVNVLTIFQRVLRGPFHCCLCTTFVEESFRFYFGSRLAWFWLDFLRTEPLCLHLPQNGEVFHVRIVVVLTASEPHVFRQILEVNVHEGNAVVFPNLPENLFVHSTVRLSSVGSFSIGLIAEHFCFGIDSLLMF